jgi:hypothetical protein
MSVIILSPRTEKGRPLCIFGSSVEDREVNDEMITVGKSGFNSIQFNARVVKHCGVNRRTTQVRLRCLPSPHGIFF